MTTFLSCIAARKHRALTTLCLLVFCCLGAFPALAGQPLRVIYVEAGPLDEYRQTLQGLAHTLHLADRLTAQPPVLTSADDARSLWRWLGKHTDGKLQFLEDGFYSAQWDDNALDEVRLAVQRRLESRGDVDVILAFGTRAGKIMASLPTNASVIVTSATNAVESGIVRSRGACQPLAFPAAGGVFSLDLPLPQAWGGL